ncbi:MAG: SPOR domain-containing protein, partial [Candidatus Omnitrophota bacterium]
GNYTIQVASYQTKKGAQKEAEIIKKKGLSVSVLSKGAYSILCVGNFKDKQKAKLVLVELKKRYRDCFIRRL